MDSILGQTRSFLARRPSSAFVAQPHLLRTPGLSPGRSWQRQEDQGGMVIRLAATTQGSSGHSWGLSVPGQKPGLGWGSGLGPACSNWAWQPGWLCPSQGNPWYPLTPSWAGPAQTTRPGLFLRATVILRAAQEGQCRHCLCLIPAAPTSLKRSTQRTVGTGQPGGRARRGLGKQG